MLNDVQPRWIPMVLWLTRFDISDVLLKRLWMKPLVEFTTSKQFEYNFQWRRSFVASISFWITKYIKNAYSFHTVLYMVWVWVKDKQQYIIYSGGVELISLTSFPSRRIQLRNCNKAGLQSFQVVWKLGGRVAQDVCQTVIHVSGAPLPGHHGTSGVGSFQSHPPLD